MPTTTDLVHNFTQVTDTPYKAGVLVTHGTRSGSTVQEFGADAVDLSDEDDTTYAEQWLSIRSASLTGPLIQVGFDAVPDATSLPPTSTYRLRFELMNESGATGTDFIFAAFDTETGLDVGNLRRPGGTTDIITAPAVDTIYDWNDWVLHPTDESILVAVRNGGLNLRLRRDEGDASTAPDGDWGLRVYEVGVVAQTGLLFAPPLRLTNRDDGLAGSVPRLTGSRSRQGSNRLTGYL